jgi:hypothetical protein
MKTVSQEGRKRTEERKKKERKKARRVGMKARE